jgi:rubrerythrin
MTRKLRKHEDPKRHWVCEEPTCGKVHADDSPPDSCQWCGGRFFDNLWDMLLASGAQTGHTA